MAGPRSLDRRLRALEQRQMGPTRLEHAKDEAVANAILKHVCGYEADVGPPIELTPEAQAEVNAAVAEAIERAEVAAPRDAEDEREAWQSLVRRCLSST